MGVKPYSAGRVYGGAEKNSPEEKPGQKSRGRSAAFKKETGICKREKKEDKREDKREKRRKDTDMEDLLQVGAIANTHGLRGEVKVFPTTDDPTRYKLLDTVIADTGKQRMTMEISGVRFFKHMVIVKFKGIDHIDDAEKLKGTKLFVTREQAVPLGEDEYFLADLEGLCAVTEDGEELGVIKDIIQTGANDVYVIGKPGGQEKDLLVPAIKECIRTVDISAGRMMIRLLPGLREANQGSGEKEQR